VIKM